MIPRKQYLPDTTGPMGIETQRYCGSRHRAGTDLSEMEYQHREGEVYTISHPEPRSYLQITPAYKVSICFLQWNLIRYVNYN